MTPSGKCLLENDYEYKYLQNMVAKYSVLLIITPITWLHYLFFLPGKDKH
jgi:hypothetical protein